MKPAKAMQAALNADKARQTWELWQQVRRRYGRDAYYRNQAYNWWGWDL